MKKLFLMAILLSVTLLGCTHTGDVAVIGGADGPTAIFVTGSPSVPLILGVIVAVAAVIAAFVLYLARKK